MQIQADIPEFVSGPALDERLARGWWRTGSLMLRTSLLHLGREMHEVVHIRSCIEAPRRSRSARRLLRRNRARFRVEIGPAVVDDARRALYRLTRPRFLGPVMDELGDLALPERRDAFDTREVAVYDGERLVAVSYFDAAERSIAAILGLYDPAYARDSLGRFTMLEEIEWARANECRYYYPGYVVPGVSAFDYKLSLDALEFLGPDGRWRPLLGAPRPSRRVDRLERRLDAVCAGLVERGQAARKIIYPAFWLGRWPRANRPFLAGQRHLQCTPGIDSDGRVLVIDHLTDHDAFVVGWARWMPDVDTFEGYEIDPELAAACEHGILFHTGERWTTDAVHEAVERALDLIDATDA